MHRLINPLALFVVTGLLLSGCDEGTIPPTSADSDGGTGIVDMAEFSAWPVKTLQATGNTDPIQADPNIWDQDNLAILVDRSSSMNDGSCGDKFGETVKALKAFIPKIPDEYAVTYYEFDGGLAKLVDLATNNRQALLAAVDEYHPTGGGTALGYAVGQVYLDLSRQGMVQGGTGTYRIVVVTDGQAGDANRLASNMKVITNTPVEVITAGFCISNHVLNQPGVTTYVDAVDASSLLSMFEQAIRKESPAFAVSFVGAVN